MPPENPAQAETPEEPNLVAPGGGAAPAPSQDVAPESQEQVDWKERAQKLESNLSKLQNDLGSLKNDSDRNVRRLQGTYQSQINDLRTGYEKDIQGWESAYDKAATAGMDEAERLAYENSRLNDRLERANTQITEVNRVAQDNQQKSQYLQWFVERGVPANELDMSSLQSLVDSGYAAERRIRTDEQARVAALEQQIADLKAQATAGPATQPTAAELGRQAGDLTPPRVAVQQPGAQTQTARTMWDVRQSLKGQFGGRVPTEEEVYKAVDQHLLPPSVLPGLEDHPENRPEMLKR